MALTLKEILAAKAAKASSIKSVEPAPAPIAEPTAPAPVPETKENKEAIVEIEAIRSRMDKAILSEAEQTVTDILPRIRALKDMQTDQLDEEMDSLKEALLANPAAVQLMMPEDVGQLVIALRKITGQALVSAAAPKKRAPKLDKVKSFTKEELLDLADDL